MHRLFLVPLAVLALLAAVPLAGAAEAEEADESAYVEEALEECEGDPVCEEEVEAEETEVEAEAEAEKTYPEACVLRSAKAHAVLKGDRLKLTIGYATSEPTEANLEVHYGATRVGQFKRQLRRSGVLRIAKPLKGRQAAKRLPVRVEIDVKGTRCQTRRLVLVPKR
ncbi:MAG TPA: hypothetical protein VHF50_07095 [Solirubrobacterales bacterium]|nr:hypothetical protein [Solirubrobacterales bacterium]